VKRVTVHASTAQEFTLPASVMAVTAMQMIGHLPPECRCDLFARVASVLCPRGLFVVHLQDPQEPTQIPLTKYVESRLGEHMYEGWAEARRAGGETMEWTMHYRVLAGKRLIREAQASFRWWTMGSEQLIREGESAGLVVRERESNLFTLEKKSD
ncbi:MAG TPA: hypothetical protein VE621_06360, partial [Bryobacteraceae bacterium]|nr:hypothetical protein [Bryobacteraceae bacterium]